MKKAFATSLLSLVFATAAVNATMVVSIVGDRLDMLQGQIGSEVNISAQYAGIHCFNGHLYDPKFMFAELFFDHDAVDSLHYHDEFVPALCELYSTTGLWSRSSVDESQVGMYTPLTLITGYWADIIPGPGNGTPVIRVEMSNSPDGAFEWP